MSGAPRNARSETAPNFLVHETDEKIVCFVRNLYDVGGTEDHEAKWLAQFCEDRTGADTFNLAHIHKYTRNTHDDRTDSSCVHITEKGQVLALQSLLMERGYPAPSTARSAQ